LVKEDKKVSRICTQLGTRAFCVLIFIAKRGEKNSDKAREEEKRKGMIIVGCKW
jgi:hypothetical protein